MIEVIRTGILTTVQDLGRTGYRDQGVAQAGALDGLSLSLANQLVGNPDNTAAIELMFGGGQFRFTSATWFALTGCECHATLDSPPVDGQLLGGQSLLLDGQSSLEPLDGQSLLGGGPEALDGQSLLDGLPVMIGWRYPVAAGQTLTLHAPNHGLCAYLAVAGGIHVEKVMDSCATDLQGGFGGFRGRALKKGDQLAVDTPSTWPTQPRGILLPQFNSFIRVLQGPEFADFSPSAQHGFVTQQWKVSPASNRMGFRLQAAEALTCTLREDLLSHGVFPGVIQVPPQGQPIILAVDGQTTGGYPRIAVIIDADLWKLGQLRPGHSVQFEWVSEAQAQAARQEQQYYRNKIAYGLNPER